MVLRNICEIFTELSIYMKFIFTIIKKNRKFLKFKVSSIIHHHNITIHAVLLLSRNNDAVLCVSFINDTILFLNIKIICIML